MAIEYLKEAKKTSMTNASDVKDIVQNILDEVLAGGEATISSSTQVSSINITAI